MFILALCVLFYSHKNLYCTRVLYLTGICNPSHASLYQYELHFAFILTFANSSTAMFLMLWDVLKKQPSLCYKPRQPVVLPTMDYFRFLNVIV